MVSGQFEVAGLQGLVACCNYKGAGITGVLDLEG